MARCAALAAVALLLPACIAPRLAPDHRRLGARTLRVTGEGKASARPDVAVATFGVEALGQGLSEASRDADERMRRILGALSQAGVAGRDLQTTRFDVSIERQQDPRGGLGPITGYRVTSEVRATLRDLGRVGALLDAVVQAGANSVHSLAFEKEDPAPELARARALAVAAARGKAEEIARAAGVALGEVLELGEGGAAPGPRPMLMRTMASAGGAPVEPGQLDFTVSVEAVFAIR
jgi:uncharacterized protein YggE